MPINKFEEIRGSLKSEKVLLTNAYLECGALQDRHKFKNLSILNWTTGLTSILTNRSSNGCQEKFCFFITIRNNFDL